MIYKNAGRRIKSLRIQKGMTQQELAEKINSGNKYISLIERGKRKPSIDIYLAIANALDVTMDYFFYDEIKNKEDMYINMMAVTMSYMEEKQKKQLLKIAEIFSLDN